MATCVVDAVGDGSEAGFFLAGEGVDGGILGGGIGRLVG